MYDPEVVLDAGKGRAVLQLKGALSAAGSRRAGATAVSAPARSAQIQKETWGLWSKQSSWTAASPRTARSRLTSVRGECDAHRRNTASSLLASEAAIVRPRLLAVEYALAQLLHFSMP